MAYTFALETLGCRLNQAESAIFARQFIGKGYRLVEDSADADLCIINTCTLTHQATSKCRRLIRSIIRRNPDVCVAAVGCYSQVGVEALQAIAGLDYIIGTADKMRLPEIIPTPAKRKEPLVVRQRAAREHFTIDSAGYYPLHTRANLKIQEGCDFVCSYCIVPKSRGPARSRDFDDISKEARTLVADGHRELIITGVNVGTYNDNGRTLVDVVDALETIDGLERVRLSSIEPTTIGERLVDRMAVGGKLCPYLHIPLQSGDDGVLERMRRKYTSAEYMEFIDFATKRVPEIGLGADVIVGFPGENQRAFERTCRLVEEIPYTNIHVFSFSARERTGAHGLADQVPGEVISERSKAFHEIAHSKKSEFYDEQKDKLLQILFEERDDGQRWVGFSDNYVKVGVETAGDISNRMGVVRVNGIANPEEKDHKRLVAAGDLLEVEETSVPLVARTFAADQTG